MTLPFTATQFLDVFRQYNAAIWPLQVVFVAVALGGLVLALRPGRGSGRIIALYLAAQWAWTGIIYHWVFFSQINPAARVFAALWVAGAVGFALSAIGPRPLSFRTNEPLRMVVGCALAAYALAIYPLLGHFTGRAYPASPTFGAPCPVTIYTFGLLWLARGPVRRWLVIVPVVWAAIGSLAAFTLGVYEDLGLLAAGISGVVLLIRPGPADRPASPAPA
jgi:hypothetical protein